MDMLKQVFDLDYSYIVIGILILIMAIKYFWEAVEWFCSTVLKIEFKRTRERREEHDTIMSNSKRLTELEGQRAIDTRQSNDNDKEIIKDLSALSNTIIKIMDKLNGMECKNDESERAKLKDKIAQSYRRYNKIKKWTQMEEEAFRDLIKDYELHGGENSFVHETCEPESHKWEIID